VDNRTNLAALAALFIPTSLPLRPVRFNLARVAGGGKNGVNDAVVHGDLHQAAFQKTMSFRQSVLRARAIGAI
jgi:hypothetical protein